jgi:hypothetical protein
MTFVQTTETGLFCRAAAYGWHQAGCVLRLINMALGAFNGMCIRLHFHS